MRRSELVAVRVEHLTELAHGIEIFLPRSKTGQERAERTVFIPQATGERVGGDPEQVSGHSLRAGDCTRR